MKITICRVGRRETVRALYFHTSSRLRGFGKITKRFRKRARINPAMGQYLGEWLDKGLIHKFYEAL